MKGLKMKRLKARRRLVRPVLMLIQRVVTAQQHHRIVLLAIMTLAAIGYGATVLWLQQHRPTRTMPRLPPTDRVLMPPSRLLPYKYWEHRRLYPENYKQITCSKFPQLEDINYAAASWQHLQVENGSMYLYGAYWDDRFGEPLVRVLVYCDVTPLPMLTCMFWYENENAPVFVPVTAVYAWEPGWGGPKDGVNEPYILGCRPRRHLPDEERPPAAVSVIQGVPICRKPTNVLNIQGAPAINEKRRPLNTSKICVTLKWVHFREDNSASLVEWIEMIKAFGADKLYVYVVQTHRNTRRALDYYEAIGFAEVTELAHPPQLRSNFSRQDQHFHNFRRELLPYNDCIYRSINKYQWLAAIDSDEIIVPRSNNTWQQVVAEVTKGVGGLDSITFRNYYILDKGQRDLAAPPYMTILGHLWRARVPSPLGFNVKSFHNISSVVAMHNHYPMLCGLNRGCWGKNANESIARLYHYRSSCIEGRPDCPDSNDTVRDDIINKWQHMVKEVDSVLDMLGIKP